MWLLQGQRESRPSHDSAPTDACPEGGCGLQSEDMCAWQEHLSMRASQKHQERTDTVDSSQLSPSTCSRNGERVRRASLCCTQLGPLTCPVATTGLVVRCQQSRRHIHLVRRREAVHDLRKKNAPESVDRYGHFPASRTVACAGDVVIPSSKSFMYLTRPSCGMLATVSTLACAFHAVCCGASCSVVFRCRSLNSVAVLVRRLMIAFLRCLAGNLQSQIHCARKCGCRVVIVTIFQSAIASLDTKNHLVHGLYPKKKGARVSHSRKCVGGICPRRNPPD